MKETELTHELIISLKQGKEKTFRVIFIAYFESLEAFANTYVGNRDIAKDLVQDAFYNLWRKKSSLPEEINLKAYLYQATRNNCLNYLKRLKVQSKYEKRTQDKYNELRLNYDALSHLNFDTLSFNELLEMLNKAIEQLPPKCREVFELSRYDGMKNREIAQLLNISEKAIEGHISKALKYLKDHLKSHYSSGLLLYLLIRSTHLPTIEA